jgi:signal transduction histidine kinase
LPHMLGILGAAVAVSILAFCRVVIVSRKNILLREHRRVQGEILEISGREQRRIGQDLHDGVCQQLGAIAFLTKMLEEDLAIASPRQALAVKDISKHLAEAISQARSVAKGLFPVKIEENGLESALEELAANTTRLFKSDCMFKCAKPVSLHDNAVALHLYYIAHEAVNNAVKHARAAHIWIELERKNGALVLSIKNDGLKFSGLDCDQGGMGLHIMKYRAQTIGGTFSIRTDADAACSVTCIIAEHN